MSRLPPLIETGDAFERELLASARGDVMSPQARARLIAPFASSGVVGGGVASAAASRAAGKGLAASAKWIGLGGLVSLVALAGGIALTPRSHVQRSSAAVGSSHALGPMPADESAMEREADRPAAETVAPAPSVPPAPARHVLAGRGKHASAPAPPMSAVDDGSPSLVAELRVIERAQAAQAAGRTGDALAALDDHDARFPSGALADEAAVLRIEAIARMGDNPTASRLAAAFVAAHPRSPYVERVQRIARALEPAAGTADGRP